MWPAARHKSVQSAPNLCTHSKCKYCWPQCLLTTVDYGKSGLFMKNPSYSKESPQIPVCALSSMYCKYPYTHTCTLTYILLTICFPIDLEVCRHLLGANAKTALATNFAGVDWQPMPPPTFKEGAPHAQLTPPPPVYVSSALSEVQTQKSMAQLANFVGLC